MRQGSDGFLCDKEATAPELWASRIGSGELTQSADGVEVVLVERVGGRRPCGNAGGYGEPRYGVNRYRACGAGAVSTWRRREHLAANAPTRRRGGRTAAGFGTRNPRRGDRRSSLPARPGREQGPPARGTTKGRRAAETGGGRRFARWIWSWPLPPHTKPESLCHPFRITPDKTQRTSLVVRLRDYPPDKFLNPVEGFGSCPVFSYISI